MVQSNPASLASVPLESSAADRVTTAWMMALLATLLAEAAGMVTSWLGRGESPAGRWTALAELALFVACTTGLVSFTLMLAALKLRRIRPPRAIVLISIVASLLPWLAVILRRTQ
jgi:hypothetical protein